jgi:hypothetical protein
MDLIQKFENNVITRLRDITTANDAESAKLDMRPSYLFMGVTIGVLISRITLLVNK